MMPDGIEEETLKRLLKEALTELIDERRDLVADLVGDVVEEYALAREVRAIKKRRSDERPRFFSPPRGEA